jgi:hypothetical protein
VSGWGRTHQNWAIDPEPLIVFTAGISGWDPRLRDEALDWCIHYWRHVSQVRLRNILRLQSDDIREGWGAFAATVDARAGTHWPEATTELAYKTTGRSALRPLTEPSLVLLRLRAMFGLGARSEILRHLLFNANERTTASLLASVTNYAKRNVADACETLAQAGVLSARLVGNRYYYALANRRGLAEFVGSVPDIAPDWNALFHVVKAIHRVSELASELSHQALVVEVHEAARDTEDDIEILGIRGARRRRGEEFLDEWRRWADEVMSDLASGSWPGVEGDPNVMLFEPRGPRHETSNRRR